MRAARFICAHSFTISAREKALSTNTKKTPDARSIFNFSCADLRIDCSSFCPGGSTCSELGMRACISLSSMATVVICSRVYSWSVRSFFLRESWRLVRRVVLSAKERDFVRAARGFGASGAYLLRKHILPQTASVVLTQAAILVPQYVLAEVTLSFLGLGVPEPVPSWGNLLANLQQFSVLASYWWMYLPAAAMVPFFLGYLGLASALQERADAPKIGA